MSSSIREGSEQSTHVWQGRAAIALAAVLWSTSGLFVKAAIFEDWPDGLRGPLLAFWRGLFAGLLMLTLVRKPRWSARLVPMTLAFATMNVTYLSAMSLTTAANAIWLQSTAPFWVLIIGLVVARQSPARADLIPLIFAAVGVGIILAYEVRGQAQAGIACGLASGASYAVVVVLLRALRDFETAWLVALNHLVTAAVLLPLVVMVDIWPSPTQLAVLVAFGVVQMGVPYLFFAWGLKYVSSQEATAIGLLEPLLLPLWVLLVGREQPAPWMWIGGGFILLGLAIRYAVPLVARSR